MTPLFIALQLAAAQPSAGPSEEPAPSSPAPQPPPVTPPSAPPASPAPPPVPPPTWEQPWHQPPPPQAYPPQLFPSQPPYPAPPPAAKERDVTWWARFELGFGTYGFAENNAILSDMGYAGAKMWATIDAAYMFHRHVGAGLLIGMNRRSSEPDSTPALNVASYFVAAELPILLAGNRLWAFYVTPRGGYAAAELELDNDIASELLHTGTFGGAVSFQSFKYHLGSSIGFMHTPTGPLGDTGRSMDFGGLYFTVGGTIDG